MERAITVLLTTLTDLVAIEGYEFGDAAGQVSQDDGAERLQGRGLLESEVKALLCYRVQGAVKAFDMSFFDGQNLYRLLHGRSSFCPACRALARSPSFCGAGMSVWAQAADAPICVPYYPLPRPLRVGRGRRAPGNAWH